MSCVFKASHHLDFRAILSDEIVLVLSREHKQSSDTYPFMLLHLEMDKIPHVKY